MILLMIDSKYIDVGFLRVGYDSIAQITAIENIRGFVLFVHEGLEDWKENERGSAAPLRQVLFMRSGWINGFPLPRE